MKWLFCVPLWLWMITGMGHTDCTSFFFNAGDTLLFGNTLDWYSGEGLLAVNKCNVSIPFIENDRFLIASQGKIILIDVLFMFCRCD